MRFDEDDARGDFELGSRSGSGFSGNGSGSGSGGSGGGAGSSSASAASSTAGLKSQKSGSIIPAELKPGGSWFPAVVLVVVAILIYRFGVKR